MQLKYFEACFMPALIYRIEVWGCIKKDEMKKIERIQGRTLKRTSKLSVSTGTSQYYLWKQEYDLQNKKYNIQH